MGDEASQSDLEQWNRLDGKVAMVTGASSGIGYEFCLKLAMAGCKIIAAARRKDRLVALCDKINQMGTASSSSSSSSSSTETRAVWVELDLSAEGPLIDASVEVAWAAFGRIDALVNAAGVREITEGLYQKKWLNNVVLKTVPLRKLGTIDPALTSLVAYLIHDCSCYVSGNVFIVDSGNTLTGSPIFSSL